MRGIVEREKRRLSFTSDVGAGSEAGSRAATPKPTPATPAREPLEISRLVPIDEYPANGHNGPNSYGSINHPSGSRINGEAERGRQANGSTHEGSYTSSPTRI
ncbi:hypothetical protein FRC12_006126 [Ceratobasidium sp. 428]|nr:hypothetical protein FRC12_006126 [Ceratobasidium sp. 428]